LRNKANIARMKMVIMKNSSGRSVPIEPLKLYSVENGIAIIINQKIIFGYSTLKMIAKNMNGIKRNQ
jgi:hypothetical protein